jgi:hypothetical protein
VDEVQARADARLGLVVAAACAVAHGALVVLPYYVTDQWLPSGIDAVWALGAMLTVVLGPVAAGLAGYASFMALWLHGDALTPASRRLHLITLLLVAVLFVAIGSAWGTHVASWWLD